MVPVKENGVWYRLLSFIIHDCFVGQVGLGAIKQKLEDVFIDNQVSLKRAFQLSLRSVSDELYQARIITQDIHKSPTYDDIIGSFISGISFINNLSQLEERCDKFLSALSNVGGPVADAADMLREEWDRVKKV